MIVYPNCPDCGRDHDREYPKPTKCDGCQERDQIKARVTELEAERDQLKADADELQKYLLSIQGCWGAVLCEEGEVTAEYKTTTGEIDRHMNANDPVIPDGDGWELIGTSAATVQATRFDIFETLIVWTWRREVER